MEIICVCVCLLGSCCVAAAAVRSVCVCSLMQMLNRRCVCSDEAGLSAEGQMFRHGSERVCRPAEDSSPENLLLHGPFSRKPKRIRTAFSPSQLLRLERAFEKNHYVVGAERKQLASGLCLTETQVGMMGNAVMGGLKF